MPFNWANQSGDAFLPQDSYPLDMDNLYAFDDSLFSINDNSTSSDSPTTLDYVPQGYTSANDHTPDFSNSPGMTMSQLSKSASYDQSTSPSSLASGMGFDTLDSAILSPQESPLDEWLLNPTSGEVTRSTEHDSSKRNRGVVQDNIAACWKSPLCPNKTHDGSRPDSCHGECADFLFAHPSELPDDKKIIADIMAKSEPRVTLDPPRSFQGRLKRSSKTEIDGRSIHDASRSPSPSNSSQASTPRSTHKERPKKATSTKKQIPALPTPLVETPKAKSRVPHNQVEKKYRENVNAQLDALRRVVPSQNQTGFDGLDMEDLGSASAAGRQPSKAAVLSSATAYIRQLEKDNARMLEEMDALKVQNRTLQSLVKCEDCSLMKYASSWRLDAQG
jgi:hypothetical protein